MASLGSGSSRAQESAGRALRFGPRFGMAQHTRSSGAVAFVAAAALVATSAVALAQAGPVAAMFRDDLKREQALALSFLPIELPAASAPTPLHVYLSAGDLERAFDTAGFRPDAAIVPTNTNLVVNAASPTTQRVLIERVQKVPLVMADLQDQIAARRKQAPAGGDGVVLQIGVDAFAAQLPRNATAPGVKGAFPKWVCLIATDFPTGGAVDRRDLFVQDRVRKGVAGCLAALDAAGAGSVMMPLLGAASAKTQSKDPIYEGQRLLKECRQLNAAAGIALGIHDFAPGRKSLREIGIVQWSQEINEMFRGGRLAQSAYRVYAEQIKQAVNQGIAGQHTAASNVDGNCASTFGQ
jgi:hypothetical protein